ncbi:ATP-binding protein [Streptomyces sp. NPDC057287]|uniref:ATP-binding protein n=1 Tax=Streptomyces sp. NPDC057287 TaxID=3346086 RepID=UPI003626F7E0
MDPSNQGPEEYGHGTDRSGDDSGRRRQSRDPLTPDFGHQTPQQSRTVQLISGDFLLTVNPVDGSEIEPCRPGERPDAPVRHTAAQRVERERAAAPPVPAGPPAPQTPLLERQDERERLVRLLARGRSVCLTGPAGSGRTALLDAVAGDCADLAPDGVLRLSGYKRTATELLYALFEAVYRAPLYRPDREGLLTLVHGIGAVVLVDDLELGGAALQELLDATPECAFLLATTPDVPAAEADLEEVVLAGLGRSASIELMEHVVERTLTDEEANWAGDLWFESEGLPLRFVQAGALLRQRDDRRAGQEAVDGYDDDPADAPFGRAEPADLALPSLGEGAAPAALLASRLSEAARETLRFAVALGGEVPHQAHLPALVGDTHADAALGELAGSGLLSPAGPRYRLAAGVLTQLEASGYGESADAHARSAAQHFAWWAGHPSVTPERAVAEADAVLASMTRLVPGEAPGQASVAVLLARSAAPAFAAGMQWGAWEKSLRTGQEAARIAGEVAEEAYFHHELGVLALCTGHLDRARAELEASIGMRGALADKSGAVAGRRALALVADRSGEPVHGTPAGEEVPAPRHDESASPPGGIPAAAPLFPRRTETSATLIARQGPPRAGAPGGRAGVLRGARRNLVAVGAGALLAAVLGTVVTLGATSGSGEEPEGQNVTTEQSASEDDGESGLSADEPTDDPAGGEGTAGGDAESPGPSGTTGPSTSGTPSPGTSGPGTSPSGTPSSAGPSDRPTDNSPSATKKPTKTPTTTPTKPPTTDPTTPTTEPTPTETPSTETPTEPETSNSASGPAETATASASQDGPASPTTA